MERTPAVYGRVSNGEVLRNESGEVLKARVFRVLETMFNILDYLLNAVKCP